MPKDLNKITRKLNDNKKLKKTLIYFISIIVFLFIFDLVIMPWYVYEPEVKVPNLINKSRAEAENILNDKDLNFRIAGTHYDEKVPRNCVILQVPAPNSIVKEGRQIALYISGGEPMVKMPSLVGKSLREAKLIIQRIGLKVGSISETEAEIERETVVNQKVSTGQEISKGSLVDLTISAGPAEQKTTVPNLFGKSLEEAKRLLAENSLVLGNTTTIPSPSLLPNTVMDQYPAPDKEVIVGDAVDLVVSKLSTK